mmetsp:Transcript_13798/g.41048  ORF Transcript_13798/g.41048 Transcript_13798/m.41048 type:complete len:292 (-) Transcript_13798:36-911(-)
MGIPQIEQRLVAFQIEPVQDDEPHDVRHRLVQHGDDGVVLVLPRRLQEGDVQPLGLLRKVETFVLQEVDDLRGEPRHEVVDDAFGRADATVDGLQEGPRPEAAGRVEEAAHRRRVLPAGDGGHARDHLGIEGFRRREHEDARVGDGHRHLLRVHQTPAAHLQSVHAEHLQGDLLPGHLPGQVLQKQHVDVVYLHLEEDLVLQRVVRRLHQVPREVRGPHLVPHVDLALELHDGALLVFHRHTNVLHGLAQLRLNVPALLLAAAEIEGLVDQLHAPPHVDVDAQLLGELRIV